jgi:hypothetical protein
MVVIERLAYVIVKQFRHWNVQGATLLVLLLITSPGCVSSVNPLYSDDISVADESLVGKWVETGGKANSRAWHVKSTGPGSYLVSSTHGGTTRRYSMRAVKLGGHTYVELMAVADLENGESVLDHIIVYNVLQLRSLADESIELFVFSADKMQALLKKNPPAEAPRFISLDGGRRLILTGTTAEIQRFVAAFGDELLGESVKLRRVR